MNENIVKDLLPKNIRQIGHAIANDKIYIEDYVMTYIKQLSKESFDNEKVLVLIGNKKCIEDVLYTFINGVIEVEGVGKYTELLENERISKITDKKENFFDGMDVMGLGIITDEEWINFNDNIYEYFNSKLMGDIVLIYDANKEEIFYRYNNYNFIKQKGHYVYYERNEPMQNYMLCMKDGKSIEYGYSPTEIVDRSIDEKIRSFTIPKNTVYMSKNLDYSKYKELISGRWNKKIKYGSLIASILVVLTVGIVKVDTFEKITKMKAKKILSKTENVMKKKNDELLDIQTIAGGIETKEPIETEKPIVKENNSETSTPIITEKPIVKKIEKSQAKKKKNFYTVKKGDALVDISRKMYGTIKKVDLIKRANGIEDENKIYIGQKILIP